MSRGADVLERSVIPAGKVFIKAGEENSRAYVIQTGEVISFMEDGEKKIEVERFGPGTIIGELCLMIDEPIALSFEAVMSTTVVTVTRQDFQKKLTKVDKTVVKILTHTVQKLSSYEKVQVEQAIKRSEIDDTAHALVQGILKNLTLDQKTHYEKLLLPPMNALIKALKQFKLERKKS